MESKIWGNVSATAMGTFSFYWELFYIVGTFLLDLLFDAQLVFFGAQLLGNKLCGNQLLAAPLIVAPKLGKNKALRKMCST